MPKRERVEAHLFEPLKTPKDSEMHRYVKGLIYERIGVNDCVRLDVIDRVAHALRIAVTERRIDYARR